METVYIIHFDTKLHHAKHYVGYTHNLQRRIILHRKGYGSKLMKAVAESNITWEVAAKFQAGRAVERAIKDQKNTSRYCPICNGIRAIQNIVTICDKVENDRKGQACSS
jgi:predicted GIY-YIG superfamily endonuclease